MSDPQSRTSSSLRRVFWAALLPLSLVIVSSFALILLMVQRVHDNVECMYVETREIAQARTLADELRGIESWVTAAPRLTPAERKVADADARQHLHNAKGILERFDPMAARERRAGQVVDDPSSPEHASTEQHLAAEVRQELALLERLLSDPRAGLENADPHVRAASRAALALSNEIEDEARELGAGLVQSSEEFVHIVLVVAVLAGVLLLAAAALFQRRVLRPLSELRDGVVQIDSGNLDLRLPVHHDDELGLLANTLQAMTKRLRAHQEDLEERVNQRTNELLRTARLADLGTLAAGVAHEINNPLAAIATCAEGLLRDGQRNGNGNAQGARAPIASDTRTREYLQIIQKEAMRARDTTARLLAFARPESGRRDAVWLSREVAEVVTMLEHSASKVGIRFETEFAANLPPVLGDPADLRQVAFNLIKNAIDASPRDTCIRVRTALVDGSILLEVSDQGTGIPTGMLDRIFEPFVTTKDPGKGTGLGLAISHRIVTDHRGSLRAANLPARGARFSVELPPMA